MTKSGVPCQTDLYTPVRREVEEVQMEKCLTGDVVVVVGEISGVQLAEVDSHVFTEVCACGCVLLRRRSRNGMFLPSDVCRTHLGQTGM